ncbi:valine--tRNA ligase [Meiothermus rufus]|uniref:valine--tRNA ligase n=1 Tax=Meiothermus rufus TaxID=604332 RepID=UPI0004083B3A|nr:valine--tRNA ligase [Meiothermus rufus]
MIQHKELPKTYDPASVEPRWAKEWAQNPLRPELNAHKGKGPFTIVIPPPNVTGSLHLGHALDNTLIDILIRFKRMQGYQALYLPGTDHAGITTQVLVERELAQEGLSRHDLGRERFLERVWAFKEKNGGTILHQLKRLGASCDWSRERFTMDPGLSRAVRRAFIEYYHQGLAYRGKRIVNWDPIAQTVVSDLEVNVEPTPGQLYTLAYPLEGGGEIQVATVRPETIFADVAIAVNPADERYRHLVGQRARIPLTQRYIPILADEAVLMDFGTGALKITPAHDPTDFEIGQRHGLEMPSVIDLNGCLTGERVPERFRGLERFEARQKVVAALEEEGYLRQVQDYTIALGYSDRTKAPIEPLLLEQWFVRMKPVAEKVLRGLDKGEMRLVPQRWEKVNRDWLENIKDWAIARQLWWGHQIPAWYDEEGNVYVPDPSNPDLDCDQDPRYAHLKLRRDPDVFDTWFSSALWPFSTLGWPDETEDLQTFYPTDVLVTGYDILFFWVARMQMSGYQFTGRAPFHTVVLHGLYLDAKGQKMSKSKGNGIDPLELVEQYGADACRFAWAYLATGGQDIRHDPRRYEQGRNFANKLYNAARFVLLSRQDFQPKQDTPTLADRWITSRLQRGIGEISEAYEAFDFGRAARLVYELVWSEFCDWYLEAAKPALREGNQATLRTLEASLATLLKLLHPIMPFLTSELYQALSGDPLQLALQDWPQAGARDLEAEKAFETLQATISATRNLRAELGLSPQTTIQVALEGPGAGLVMENLALFRFLSRAEARLGRLERALAQVTPSTTVYLQPEGDLQAFLERQRKRLAELRRLVEQSQKKLANPGFVERADPAIVQAERERLAENQAQLERIQQNLARLESH